MKRLIAILFVVLMAVCLVVGSIACSSHTCDFCGKKKATHSEKIFGETVWYCDDCYNLLH